MPKEFLKSLLWAVGLHGGMLGILLFSWPFLAQSVFSFDRYRIFKVSLVSPHLSSQSVPGEAQKISSSERFENQKNPPPLSGSSLPVPESTSSLGESPILSGEDQGEKKESGLGISFSPQVSQPENTLAKSSAVGSPFAVPRYGQNREPYYPAAARELGWQGTALLKVLVLRNGSVGSLEILRSSGYSILDRSALKAVKEWKFVPAQKDGQPIEIGVEIPVTFRLE